METCGIVWFEEIFTSFLIRRPMSATNETHRMLHLHENGVESCLTFDLV